MPMKNEIPDVDHYLSEGCGRCKYYGTAKCKVHHWTKELKQLRSILQECGLTEEIKWGMPCYTYKGANILILAAFKQYCALNFFKGALLKDEEGIMCKAGENSQSARQIRFTDVKDIDKGKKNLKAYIHEALEVEKAGLKVKFKAPEEHSVPEEFQKALKKSAALKKAFYALTPGRQRAYLIFFSAPKQSQTRESRIEKCTANILNGIGLNDR